MLKFGFWAPFWYESENIWIPIGYYRGNSLETTSNESIHHNLTPPVKLLEQYIVEYMHDMWNVDVKDYTKYINALTHKSYQSDELVVNNERLEFLGDSVLQIVITEYLYNRYMTKSEGFLTKVRMKLINGGTLSEIGYKLKLDQMIRASSRLKQINKKLIEDAFEAIVCVIYQEHGLHYVRKILIDLYEGYINFDDIIIDNNYKELLLKYAQKNKSSNDQPNIVEYSLLDSLGPSHSKLFRIQVMYNNKALGIGMGSTRRSGEQAAARETLTILGISSNLQIDA